MGEGVRVTARMVGEQYIGVLFSRSLPARPPACLPSYCLLSGSQVANGNHGGGIGQDRIIRMYIWPPSLEGESVREILPHSPTTHKGTQT